MMSSSDRTFRMYEVQLKLLAYLRLHNISYARLAVCAIAARLPIESPHKQELIAIVRRDPFKPSLSPFSLSRIKTQSSDPALCHAVLLGKALELMGFTHIDFVNGDIRYPRLSFLMWLLSQTDDRDLLETVAIGLKQPFPCQVNEYSLSQGIGGQKWLSRNAKHLIVDCCRILTGETIEFSDLFD